MSSRTCKAAHSLDFAFSASVILTCRNKCTRWNKQGVDCRNFFALLVLIPLQRWIPLHQQVCRTPGLTIIETAYCSWNGYRHAHAIVLQEHPLFPKQAPRFDGHPL